MTEVLKAHQNLPVRLLCTTSRKEGAQREIQVTIDMFPNLQNSELQVDAETSVHTNTRQNLLIAIHIPPNDERQMQIQKNQSDDKTKTE